jgi:hypothetical protein
VVRGAHLKYKAEGACRYRNRKTAFVKIDRVTVRHVVFKLSIVAAHFGTRGELSGEPN